MGRVTQVMLSLSMGLFIQSFAITQISCSQSNCWVIIPIMSILASIIMLFLFLCIGDWVLYVVAGTGLYWLLNQLLPGIDSQWTQGVAYIVYAAVVLAGFVIVCSLKKRIRNILLDWIISAIACAVIVYYVDYWQGASFGVITGPTIDLIGPEEYPYQTLYHIVEMTVLYALNRAGALSSAIALQCYSSRPGDCAYRCRNNWCCCCCDTDRPAQNRARERIRMQRVRPGRPDVQQIDDLDYGPTEEGSEWRTVPERAEGEREGYTNSDDNEGKENDSSDDSDNSDLESQ
jgi:hypothetical protein